MGGRRLHRQKAIALLWAAGLALLLASCGGDGKEARATATLPLPTVPTASPAPPATPTPTVDPVGDPPKTAAEAASRLAALLEPRGGCPAAVVQRWSMVCAEGDLDRDGAQDFAYLVPVSSANPDEGEPAAVLVCRSGNRCALDRFPATGPADATALGTSAFAIEDVTGDGRPEVRYLQSSCSAGGCRTSVEVQAWDGTAWRDLGPGDGGLDNVEAVTFKLAGQSRVLSLHGGQLPERFGPTRGVTIDYSYSGARFVEIGRTFDRTVYLIHAVLDADALFDTGDYAKAALAYGEAAIAAGLRDWKADTGRSPTGGAPTAADQLKGYALFRVALATALAGSDPMAALDAAIVTSKEPVFANAAQAFRRGLQESGSVRGGCLEATGYLGTGPIPAYIADMFDYGPANPRKGPRDICPF